MAENSGTFRIVVPLDASGIKSFNPDRKVKVAAYSSSGAAVGSTVASFDAKGQGEAVLSLDQRPGAVRIVLGPENASDADLQHLQTLSVNVSRSQLGEGDTIRLNPILIPPYYWDWWLWWCREFTITGRLVCADGSPVPGAQVCAYDATWWWWWVSEQQVGCATTDATGAFVITFTHCCGWYPWWWWQLRNWRLEPVLVDRIAALLREDPTIGRLPLPSVQPSLSAFQQLLSPGGPGAPRAVSTAAAFNASQVAGTSTFDPSELESLRNQLVARLPAAPQFEAIRLWPWWPWWPWLDCDVNILFKARQNCAGQNTVIVNESIWDARDNIPTSLNVTLTANDQACCLVQCPNPPQCSPEGDCILLSGICDDDVGTIGGNVGAPASPVGLLNPGMGAALSYGADRPYSGDVPIQGSVGDTVDYYEFLVSTSGFSGPWSQLPAAAVGGFNRQLFVAPSSWPLVPFMPNAISDGTTTHLVFETIQHYENNNLGPFLWGPNCYFTLMGLVTAGVLPNGTYYLQVVGWTRPGYTGNISSPRVLPLCDTKNPNGIVLTIDNQTTNTTGPTDFYGQPCGTGTVHVCTVQPETAFLQMAIGATILGPCSTVCISPGDTLVIDFVAYDPDAFLAYYTLNVTYGASLVIDLLSLAGTTLTPSPIPPLWAPAAAQVGSDYGSALTQGAVSPAWSGGAIRLSVPASEVFPETCAYEFQLYAFKRTIGCGISSTATPPTTYCGDNHSYWNQYNLSEQSITVIVPVPPATCEPTSTAS
jgi:hypothetical protein